jgi:hypothetical protein
MTEQELRNNTKEINETKQKTIQHILDANFYMAIVITPNAAGCSVVGNGTKFITALLDDEVYHDGILLTQVNELRAILNEIITDYLDVSGSSHFKAILELKKLSDKIKQKRNEARND